jgi:hypothetical protein
MTEPRTRKAKARLRAAATALSVAAHGLVIAALWLHSPRLVRPHEEAGPPEPVIPILILPRTPPAAPGAAHAPEPIRLHRRRLHPELAPPPEVPPLVAPKAPPQAETPTATRAAAAPRITVLPTPAGQLAAVLRASPLGCANPSILTREEREACLARLGRGAAGAPYLPPAMDRAKQAGFEAAGAARDRNIRLKEAPVPTGVAQPGADSGASNRNKPLYTPTPPPLRP